MVLFEEGLRTALGVPVHFEAVIIDARRYWTSEPVPPWAKRAGTSLGMPVGSALNQKTNIEARRLRGCQLICTAGVDCVTGKR